jgi:glycosyltransferase involved in cell wall biosynthesis
MPLVSICIPTRSARRLAYLGEAVASARAQTHADLEIILSDNGHDEAIRAFAREQESVDPRVRYRRNDPSVSLGGNFNAALQSARGDYVLFNGDDDRLLPTCIERLLAAHSSDTVLAFANHYVIDAKGDRDDALTRHHVVAYGRSELPAGRVADPVACAWSNSVPIPASLIRAAEAQRVGINVKTTPCDVELFVRLANEVGTFVFVPEFLTEYRVHLGSESAAGVPKNLILDDLVRIPAPRHVEPIKRRFIGEALLAAVSAALKAGKVAEARALIGQGYYPTLRERPSYVLMQRPVVVCGHRAHAARRAQPRRARMTTSAPTPQVTRPYAIVTGDFVRTGGMDAPNYALASFLARRGNPVHLVTYRADETLLAYPNVTMHRVRKPIGAYSLGSPFLAGTGYLHAAAIAREGGNVVVNGGNCPFPGVNWVHYVHAAFTPIVSGPRWRRAKTRMLHGVNQWTERNSLLAARVVIANSERTRRDLVERVGVPDPRIRTIYYGVDPTQFRPPAADERESARAELGWTDGRPRVVFVGALGDRRKGFDTVHDAWRTLCGEASWDADLVVVGTGTELPKWQERARRDGIADRVSFLGFRRDVFRILWASDVLVAPTRYEAYGAGVHEALCSGLPALVSSEAGVAERYPPSLSALLLDDPESATELARRLRTWAGARAEWREQVLALSSVLRARDWDVMAGDIVALCEESA